MSAPTTERPHLSVVIASTNRSELLDRCVRALREQAPAVHAEVIVVRASDLEAGIARHDGSPDMPWLRWLDAPARSTVPQLRGIGMAAARADRIALLEDDCIVGAGWSSKAIEVDASLAATGGAVEPGPYHRAIDWAIYFCEYGRFMRPIKASANAPLTGNNVVYSRQALDRLPAAFRSEFREAFVHAAWHREGVPTAVDDGLIVTNVNTWTSAHLLSVPFHHGRAFAAQRFAASSLPVRAVMAVATLGLPVLKAARVAGEALSRQRMLGRLATAFPWILVFVTCWSAGELAGCLRGPGDSAERWR